MARNKYPEITENRILDSATRLFIKNGWEKTTIQDIIDDLGDLTRGAFYHHFKSKEDIIDAVLNKISIENNPFKKVKDIKNITALEKIKKAFLISLDDTAQIEALKNIPQILKSPKMLARQLQLCVNDGAIELLELIKEGNIDKSIDVGYPKQTSETFVLLTNLYLSPIIFEEKENEYENRILHIKQLYQAIGLDVIDDDIVSRLKQLYTKVNEDK